LILLGKVTVLQSFVDSVDLIIIPEEVREEYLKKQTFEVLLIEKEIERGKIVVQKSDAQKAKSVKLEFNLDQGEAAAYSLFDGRKHGAILTDDRELIKLCRIERIPFVCALAIIVRLYEKKIVDRRFALEKIDKLVEIGRYSKEIVHYFKKEVN